MYLLQFFILYQSCQFLPWIVSRINAVESHVHSQNMKQLIYRKRNEGGFLDEMSPFYIPLKRFIQHLFA